MRKFVKIDGKTEKTTELIVIKLGTYIADQNNIPTGYFSF